MSADLGAADAGGSTGDTPDAPVFEHPFGLREASLVLTELEASWRSVAGVKPSHQLGVRIGGVPMVFQSADAALLDRLRPALDHHQSLDGDGDAMVVRIWTLGSPVATVPTLPPALAQRGDVSLYRPDGSQIRARFEDSNRALMAWDSDSDVAWWCLESIDGLQWWEEAAPFRPLLSWILPAYGRHLAHCAAVGTADGAIVMVGPGGSGKSTTALGCHLDGMGYVGDDYCLIATDTGPVVHSLYGTAKARIEESIESGPLAGHMLSATPPAGGKAVAVVSARPGAHLVDSAPVSVIAAVSVGPDHRTRVCDATRAEVLAALAPNSLLQLPGVTPASFVALSRLVQSAPVCRIELGHDRQEVTAVVRAVLADPTLRRS